MELKDIKVGQVITVGDLVKSYSDLYDRYKKTKSRKIYKFLVSMSKTEVRICG